MKPQATPSDQAQNIAIAALSWIAADGEQISRFMALTGIEPDQIRQAANERGFLAGVLEFLMGHEPTLLQFCEENEINPADIQRAYGQLAENVPGPGDFV